jgi:murein peptide amidase A
VPKPIVGSILAAAFWAAPLYAVNATSLEGAVAAQSASARTNPVQADSTPHRPVLDPSPGHLTRPQSVADVCIKIAAKLASVSQRECLDRELLPTGATSVWGTHLLHKEYPPLPPRTPRARILLVGGIHGDEYATVSVVFKWMRILDKHHSGLFHWRVVPLMNPDGLLREKSQRMNANGVDLNRNLPTPNWKEESTRYWVDGHHRNPRRYPGPAPGSEPENRWLIEEIERFNPDAIVAVHAPHGIVDFDGPPEGPTRLGALRRKLLGVYPGSLGNFAGLQQNRPVVTIELASAGHMPSRAEISRIWVDLVRWLISRFPATPSTLRVTKAAQNP